jgi:hypothetical protein
MVSLLSVGVSKIKINEESNLEQGTLNQIIIEVVLSTMKLEVFCVRSNDALPSHEVKPT